MSSLRLLRVIWIYFAGCTTLQNQREREKLRYVQREFGIRKYVCMCVYLYICKIRSFLEFKRERERDMVNLQECVFCQRVKDTRGNVVLAPTNFSTV